MIGTPFKTACLAMIFVLLAGSGVFGQTAPLTAKDPIRIKSDQLEARQELNQVDFAGHVVARHGDVTIYADLLSMFYQQDRKEIDRIEANGHVRIVQGDRVATAGKAIYVDAEGTILLSDGPRVHQGDNFVEGEEIVYFIHEEKSLVRSKDGTRVNAVFQPGGDDK